MECTSVHALQTRCWKKEMDVTTIKTDISNGGVPDPIAPFSDKAAVNRILDDVMKLKLFEPPYSKFATIKQLFWNKYKQIM